MGVDLRSINGLLSNESEVDEVSFVNPVVGAAVLGYVIWGQLRRRPARLRLTLPAVLMVLGASSLGAYSAGHRLGADAAAVLAAGLVFDAVGLAALRAYTVRLWVEQGRLWRQGSWITAALWLVGAGGHAALDAAAGTGSASYLLYLGVTLAAQRLVLHGRARRLAGARADSAP